ncbi:MAG: hypothetical protein B6U76_11320 [Desulfurococcales archaeon ex4484_217_2]|nr:MAG: hypothetical protein B6U76_11320 [Desulfurococcales archaeon ex4484_217_2]
MNITTKHVTVASLYAALYATITILETVTVGTLAYGPIQVRVSDALLPLPMIHGVANLVAGVLAAKASKGKPLLASTYAVLAVTLIVGTYLPLLFPIPLWFSYANIFAGEAIAIYLIGYPLLKILQKTYARTQQ